MPTPSTVLSSDALATAVLKKLNVIGPGRSARPADVETVTDEWLALWAEWVERKLILCELDALPLTAKRGAVATLCCRTAEDLTGQPYTMTEKEAEALLIKANAAPASAAPAVADYM